MSWLSRFYRLQFDLRQWLYSLRYRWLRHPTPVFDPDRPPARVLIVMTGLLGDSVMSTPLILETRRLWPIARITLLGRPHNCTLLAGCPALDECHATTAQPFSLRGRRGMAQLEVWLRGQAFDVAIIALGDHFAGLLAKIGIPVRVGVRGHLLEACMTHSHHIGSPRTWGPWQRLGALRALRLKVEDVRPRLWVAEDAKARGRRRLLRLGHRPEEHYVVVHAFGSTAAQWWPAERLDELARSIRLEFGLPTILIGGPETAMVPISSSSNLIDARGELDLEELLAVIAGARLVISTDSGPFHIAGTLGRPLVGLFRARRPEHACRYRQADVLFGCHDACDIECRWDRCRARPCRQMGRLSLDDILIAVRGRLSRDKSGEQSSVIHPRNGQ